MTKLYRPNPIRLEYPRRVISAMPRAFSIPILFVTGLPCSGKTEFLNTARSMPLLCIEWSQVLRKALDSYREAGNREKALKVVKGIVKEKGATYFPEEILLSISEQIAKSPSRYQGVVVSGARNFEEIRILAEPFARSLVVILLADCCTRYQRSKKRGRTEDPVDIEEFVLNDSAELRSGVAAIAYEMAQVSIVNEGGLPEFTTEVRNLLKLYFLLDLPSGMD